MNIHNEMSILPSELRLKIKSYGVEHRLDLSDNDIIEAIKAIEPSFDHEVWQKDVISKVRCLEYITHSKRIELYNMLNKYLPICLENDAICLTGILDQQDRSRIRDLLSYCENSNMEYPITIKDTYEGHRLYTRISTWDANIRDIITSLWLFKNKNKDRHMSYIRAISNIEESKSPITIRIASLLHIPISLDKYLIYVIKRQQEEKRIKKLKYYPLYDRLKSSKWGIRNNILSVNTEKANDCFNIEALIKNLSGQEKIGMFIIPPYQAEINVHDKEITQLIEIDTFYYPYIPQYIYYLE